MTAERTAAATAAPSGSDPLAGLDPSRRALLVAVAGHLIPAAHGMPSAAEVVGDERLRFVLSARPDLRGPLGEALRPELGDDPVARLVVLERDEPDRHAALVLVVVGAYYTDREVRDRLGYPGQQAKTLRSWEVPDYIEEGLIDEVLSRGPVWRDPDTGVRADPVRYRPHAAWRGDEPTGPAVASDPDPAGS